MRFSNFDWNAPTGVTDVDVYSVVPIPLPATALSLLSGVAAVSFAARRRKAA